MTEIKKLIFNAPDPDAEYKFLGFRTTDGSFVEHETVVFEYRPVTATSMETTKFKAACSGVIKPNRKFKRGSIIKNGDEIGEVSDCPHHIVMKDLCATCGKDLRIVDEVTGKPKEKSSAHVSMVHHVPELVVSKDMATKFGQEDYEKVLKAKKLILLVDLDQTLIHTTNRPVPEKELLPDIYQYFCADGRYYTKLRPHCREFLERMNQLYEMHIISFGQRYYAHKIAKILDEEQRYFAQRIMSRDELNSVRHKMNNINALFPIVDQRKMIVIIDDRDDVWQYCEALIRVKPYKYFAEVDDINAPPANSKTTEKTEDEDSADKEKEGEDSDKTEKQETEKEEAPPIASSPALNQDNDDVLEDIGRVLTEVHRTFFEHYEKNKELADASGIISYMRKKVLQNEVIALSGLIPVGTDKTRSIIYRLCVQFGATVVDDLVDETTVLIAARPSTEKVRLAMKRKIPIVTPEWLYTCTAKWICVPKKDYQHVGLHVSQFKEKRRQEEAGNQSPRLCGIEALSKEVLKTMEEEVDEELGDLSESSDEEHGSDTSAEDMQALEPVLKIPVSEEKPGTSLDDEEEDDDNRSKLLERLNSGGDSDEEDEVMRNGDIESRTRKRAFESTGMDDDDEGPSSKRMSLDVSDLEEDLDPEMQDDDDDSDELEAELEHQLNG